MTVDYAAIDKAIRACETADDAVSVYVYNASYESCLDRLEEAQMDQVPIEAWAEAWARSLTKKEADAVQLNKDRKVALLLLYRLCDLKNENKITNDDIVKKFRQERIQRILRLCLVMDRANALYNMVHANKRGMHWFAKRNTAQEKQAAGIPEDYDGGHMLNRRILELCDISELELLQDPDFARWIKPAVSNMRLEESTGVAKMPETDNEEGTKDASHPSMWSISYTQLVEFHQEASKKFGEKYGKMTMHDITDKMIRPRCQQEEKSYALHLNPSGLKLDVFVTHAWNEPFGQFVESLIRVLAPAYKKPNLWICSFALNQADPDRLEQELTESPLSDAPFVKALKDAKRYVVARNGNTDVFTRIWCVCEVMYAKHFDLIPDRTDVTGPGATSKKKITCMDAKAKIPKDRDKIIKELLNDHSREGIDDFINDFRLH